MTVPPPLYSTASLTNVGSMVYHCNGGDCRNNILCEEWWTIVKPECMASLNNATPVKFTDRVKTDSYIRCDTIPE